MALSTELHNQILSAIEVNVAIIDADGVIVDISESWTQFAKANGASLDSVGVGINYLDICRRSAEVSDARSALAGILSVMNGHSPQFRHLYRCDAPGERRLFAMTVKPLSSESKAAIVAHHNHTEMETTEILYGHLLDSVRAIVWRAELPGFRTTFASKQVADILGYPAERWTSDPAWWMRERGRIVERVRAGLARAKAQGTKLGRRAVRFTERQLAAVANLSVRDAAKQLGVSVNTYQKARRVYQQTSPASAENLAQNVAA